MQVSTSIRNTHFRRYAQLIATRCSGAGFGSQSGCTTTRGALSAQLGGAGITLPEAAGAPAADGLFKINTGCREQKVCGLKWNREVKVPELETSVFIFPGDVVKKPQVPYGGAESCHGLGNRRPARTTPRVRIHLS